MSRRRPIAFLVLWLGFAAGSQGLARGDDGLTHIGLTGESSSTARRLAAVEKMVAEKQWAEAVDEYVHILDEVGDDLVPVDPRHCVQARRLGFQGLIRLTAVHPPALRQYRERADGPARKWWEQAAAAHDVRLLRRIVQEAFCSRFADRALDLLGDLAFERGDFEEADQWWRMLAPPIVESAKGGASTDQRPAAELVFPDPQVDVARMRAKQIILQMVQGNRAGLADALTTYQSRHGEAEGALAGRKAKYLDTLKALAAQADLLTAPAENHPWTTFGGDPSRQCPTAKAPSRSFLANPPLRIGAATVVPSLKASTRSRSNDAGFPFYPVIAGGLVLVADATHVTAYDCRTGRLTGSYDLFKDLNQRPGPYWELATQPGARYTLTVAENRIFVRLGNQLSEDQVNASDRYGSFIVCLNLQPGDDGRLQRRWLVRCQEAKTLFEGSPVVSDGRAYITRVRVKGAQATTAVECYNAATGSRHWRRDVCEIREHTDTDRPARHQLLTLAGPNVVYCSHSGAVVALDAVTGRRSWAVRYPSRGTRTVNDDPSPRDLAPCVYAGGKLFVAPADYDRILGLGAATGDLLWESQAVEAVHLLGVAGQKLILTTHSRPRGIRALDTATGKSLREWMQPPVGDSDLPAQGRGFLAGGKVFWPTQEGLWVLDQDDGQPDPADGYYFSKRFGKRLGNLAFGEGCLAMATADELRLFVPPGHRLESLRKEASANPDSALAQYRLRAGVEQGAKTAATQAADVVVRNQQKPGRPRTSQPTVLDVELPLVRSWHIGTAPGERMLSPVGPTTSVSGRNSLFFACGPVLTCREAETGATRWQRTLPGPPTWVAFDADRVVAAGAHGLQCLSLAKGNVVWDWITPADPGTEEADSRVPDEDPAWIKARALDHFQATANRLFFLQGERRLFAMDLETGGVLWHRWAPGAPAPVSYSGGRFNPLYHAGNDWLVLQTSGGRRLVLDAATGRNVHQGEGTSPAWSRRPLPLGQQRLGLVAGSDQVAVFDPATGREIWTHRTRRPSISMDAPQLFHAGENIYQIVDGWYLERLNQATGQTLAFQVLGSEPIALDRSAWDEKMLYFVSRNILRAQSLADGKRLWQLPLPGPDAPWQVSLTRRYLVLFPTALPVQPHWSPAFGTHPVSFPFFGSHPLTIPFQGRCPDFPVLICDPADGKITQRLNFETQWPLATVQILNRRLAVALAGGAWGLQGLGEAKSE